MAILKLTSKKKKSQKVGQRRWLNSQAPAVQAAGTENSQEKLGRVQPTWNSSIRGGDNQSLKLIGHASQAN